MTDVALSLKPLSENLLSVGLSLPRIAAAFLILPLLSQETVPALVRNSLIVTISLVIFPLAVAATPIVNAASLEWPTIILKEIFLGAVIGFVMSTIFWALGLAGAIVDTQSGGNMANALDPLQGHQTTLTSQLLSRFACWLFMASGGFLIFIDLLLSSYALWPIASKLPTLNAGGIDFFMDQFGYIMTTGVLLSAPAILVLALVDIGFGLTNRYAQQLNVSSLSAPVKYWIGLWLTLLNIGILVEIMLRKLDDNKAILETLDKLF